MNKRLLYAGLFGGLGLIIFTLFSAIPTPAPETEILATSHDIEPEPEMESGSDPTPPPRRIPPPADDSLAIPEDETGLPKPAGDAAASLPRLLTKIETAGMGAIEPEALATLALGLLARAEPRMDTAELLGGRLQYDLEGLPQGMHGSFIIRRQAPRTSKLADQHMFSAWLVLPYEEPTWVGGVPRTNANVFLSGRFSKNWEIVGYDVNAFLFADWPAVEENSLAIEEDKSYFQGITYTRNPDGKVFVSPTYFEHDFSKTFQETNNPNLLVGEQELSLETQGKLTDVMKDFTRKANPKKFATIEGG